MKQFFLATLITASIISNSSSAMDTEKDWGHNGYLLQKHPDITYINVPKEWEELSAGELVKKAGQVLEHISYEGDKNAETSVTVDLAWAKLLLQKPEVKTEKSSLLQRFALPATGIVCLGVGYLIAKNTGGTE